MDTILPLIVVCGSSLLLWLVGRLWLRLKAAALAAALGSAVEILGAALLFWAANVALSSALAMSVRGLHLGFVSLYLGSDVLLPAAALLQALAFDAWRRHSSASS
jgi:hypothetical protein